MAKRTVFTTISPLPIGVSREVVIDFLHNHTEMIDLNPLVIERHFINPPQNVDLDERKCVWYSMTDRIDYLPGGKVSGDISYTCAFHDLPNGIQTHCRAPMGVDIRNKWTLNGSLPGEPSEPIEMGIGAPTSGLYLREDVDLRCNILMTSFVKRNLKKSHATLVSKLVEKASHFSIHSTPAGIGGRISPPSFAHAMSHPWLAPAPTQASVPRRQDFNMGISHGSPRESFQETRSTSSPTSSMFIETPKLVSGSTVRYSNINSYNVSQPYRAPSQHSSHVQVCSDTHIISRMPSQHGFQAQYYSAHLSSLRASAHPTPQQQQVAAHTTPPYPDNEDVVPAPLRVGHAGSQTTAASINSFTLSSRSRSSSEYEQSLYPHLSPYSSRNTERSISPDEPRSPPPASFKRRDLKGNSREAIDHPEVLRPGGGRLSGRLDGPSMAEME